MFLTGKVAAITGGGRGIGRATALKLASAGATIVVVARNKPELDSVVAEIEAQNGQAMALVVDVTLSTDVESLAAELQEIFGQIDILVNCAGVALIAPLSTTSEADWDRVMDTNLKGTYLCTRALLGLLGRSDSALVVNIASKVGLTGHATVTAYSAAKAGVIGFSRALAQELGPENIRVVAICPGPVDTPMRWEATPQMDPKLALSAETVADTILFLAKLDGDVITGEIVIETLNYDESLVPIDQ
jgi:NAD(P)-dependent dehydrogenase (short-subunit alcohol dehydrogenase family)